MTTTKPRDLIHTHTHQWSLNSQWILLSSVVPVESTVLFLCLLCTFTVINQCSLKENVLKWQVHLFGFLVCPDVCSIIFTCFGIDLISSNKMLGNNLSSFLNCSQWKDWYKRQDLPLPEVEPHFLTFWHKFMAIIVSKITIRLLLREGNFSYINKAEDICTHGRIFQIFQNWLSYLHVSRVES